MIYLTLGGFLWSVFVPFWIDDKRRILRTSAVCFGLGLSEGGILFFIASGFFPYLGEKTICDIFHRYGIPHEREVAYPGSRAFRADWAVGETLIEYFGLAGDPGYDERTKAKRKLAVEHGLTMIALYPKDLAERSSLLKKLGIDAPRPLRFLQPDA